MSIISRITIFSDHSLTAETPENYYHLSPSGNTVCIQCKRDLRNQVRQRTAFLLSSYRPVVLECLAFRNKYLGSQESHFGTGNPYPVVLHDLVAEQTEIITLANEITLTTWPSLSILTHPKGRQLVHVNERKENCIQSTDRLVSVTLAENLQSFVVRYPCWVKDGKYAFMEQNGSVMDAPEYWRYPLWVLLKHCGVDPTFETNIPEKDHAEHTYIKTPIPTRPTDPNISITDIRYNFTNTSLKVPILVRLTNEYETIVFRFINPTKTDNWDVEVLLSDKSFIRTLHGKFMSLYYCENAEPVVELAMEPLDAVPETFSRGFRTYALRNLATSILKLLSTPPPSPLIQKPPRTKPVTIPTSSKIKETATIPDIAELTAFEDGRVTGLFSDRVTIHAYANLSTSGQLSRPLIIGPYKIQQRDGEWIHAEHLEHFGKLYKEQLHVLVQFVGWAYKSPYERVRVAMEREKEVRGIRELLRRYRG